VTEHLCVIDQRRQYERAAVCNGCRTWLDRTLVEIVELYALLPANLLPGQAHGQRVSGSREAPLPLRVDPLDLMMPAATGAVHDEMVPSYVIVPVEVDIWLRATPDVNDYEFETVIMRQRQIRVDAKGKPIMRPSDSQVGAVSVASVLDSWARDWADVRDMGETLPAPTVVELAKWLGHRTDWACDHHAAVDDYADEIRRLYGALKAAVGLKSDRVYVGPCPITDDKGTCGAALTADPYLDIIRCPRCDTMWSRDKWLWLGMTIRAEVA